MTSPLVYYENYNGVNHTLQEIDARLSAGENGAFVIVTGIGIVMMQVGFMALEVGTVRAKHVKACLFKTVVDHSLGAIGWYLVGYALFNGMHPFAAGEGATWFYYPPTEFPRLFQQYGFAVTASTLVSGSVISRCKLWVYLVFSLLLGMFLYPIQAHWAWAPGGFLAMRGFKDFAGSGVVHCFGGACALIGAMACGPRVGRFGESGDGGSEQGSSDHRRNSEASEYKPPRLREPFRHRMVNRACGKNRMCKRVTDYATGNSDPEFRVREQLGHSSPMVVLGGLFLYVAWFSFNAGSSGGVSTPELMESAGRAAVNTMLAPATATVVSLLWCAVFREMYEIDFVVNCMLGGLVAVTGPCGYIDPWAGMLVGILAVPMYTATSKFVLYYLHVDDPLDAVAVHWGCGALGLFWTGLTDLKVGVVATGNSHFLVTQIIGILCITTWAVCTSSIYFYGLRFFLPLIPSKIRLGANSSDYDGDGDWQNPITYSYDAQLAGLDFFFFGGSGFPDFDVEAVAEFNATQRIKKQLGSKKKRQKSTLDGAAVLDMKESSQHKLKNVSSMSPTNSGLLGSFASPNPSPTGATAQAAAAASVFSDKNSEPVMVVDSFEIVNPRKN